MYQTTAGGYDAAAAETVDNKAMLGVLGFFVGAGLSLGIGLFWTIGAIGLWNNNIGLLGSLRLEGIWRTLFFAYPFVVLACLVIGTAAFLLKRHLEAAAVATLPVLLVPLYYFALVLLR